MMKRLFNWLSSFFTTAAPLQRYRSYQQVFDAVWTHFIVKGNPASLNAQGRCCFSGTGCAIGCLIDDKALCKEMDFHNGAIQYKLTKGSGDFIPRLYAMFTFLGKEDDANGISFLESLQSAHDVNSSYGPKHFHRNLRRSLAKVAKEQKLDIPLYKYKDLQDVFDTVWNWFIRLSNPPGAGGETGCFYAKQCAVGCLIDDPKLREWMDSGGFTMSMYVEGNIKVSLNRMKLDTIFANVAIKDLLELQARHDRAVSYARSEAGIDVFKFKNEFNASLKEFQDNRQLKDPA